MSQHTCIVLATIRRAERKTDVVKEVTYKLVHSVHCFDLKNKDNLAFFASVFIATVKSTMP